MSRFNASTYYRLTGDTYGSERAISVNGTTPRDLRVTPIGRSNGENWQFLYQDGVYFIRNILYNTSFQLGLSSYYLSAPVMLQASTELGQQWLIDPWGDGTFKLTNRLVGTGVANLTYIGVGEEWNTVLMLPRESGSKWTITANPDAGSVSGAMLQTYNSIQTPTAATATATSSTATSTASPDTKFFHPGVLLPIDKAGIAMGATSILILVVLFCFVWRRYKKHGTLGLKGVPGPTPPPRQPPRSSFEVLPEPPPAYNAPPSASFATTQTAAPDYYARNHFRRKAADEESIELPAYGRPTTQTRNFV